MSCLQLRPFEREHLPLVEPWFADAATRRWLGGPGWPRLMPGRASRPLGEFRGAAETGRYRWLAWDQDAAVGYIGCGASDRWATWEGGPGGRGVIGTIDVPAGSITYVVDPALRRRGYRAAMVSAVLAAPELEHIELFTAGAGPASAGSVGCLRRAGAGPLDPGPDWEGVVYYSRLQHPATPEGPTVPRQPPR
jgi:RimJ/RimL family protein N-acetyltransferase